MNKIYNDAITYCITVFENEWQILGTLSDFDRKSYAEHLIHNTKNNKAKYDFDSKFYKLPIYLRRAVINTSLGYLSSYHSNYDNWLKNGKKGKHPTLQTHLHEMPVFYNYNMSRGNYEDNTLQLKVFKDNDWKWVTVNLKKTDIESVRKHSRQGKISAPMLERKNNKWFLRFAIEEKVDLNKTKLEYQRILAVDLGVNTDATCSVMNIDGTILGRHFINETSDKDQLYHTLNKIKKIQSKYNNHNTDKLWRIATFRNQEIAKKVANRIVDLAEAYECDVIVFEHLDFKGSKSRNQRLTMWKKNTIQRIVENKAHRLGIRIRRVNAWGTSKLAYDGSGKVLRGKDAGFDTNKVCRFTNGKIYNCDLSASYNIGARYFIGQLEKTMPVKVWSHIQAKVPECVKRTQCTYSTLLAINNVA